MRLHSFAPQINGMKKGFIFDLNGTMIDDMEYHSKAWYSILNEDLGANLSWEQVKEQMYGKNEELLVRIFGSEKFTREEMVLLSEEKEKRYQSAFKPYLQLIGGLDSFLEKAYSKGIKMAIGSAAINCNIAFVLDNLDIRHYFSAIVCADDVTTSKPHPETFLKAADQLNLAPSECIVFEDAPKGVEAALHAGMKTVVLTTMHRKEEFAGYSNILCFVEDYNSPVLNGVFC